MLLRLSSAACCSVLLAVTLTAQTSSQPPPQPDPRIFLEHVNAEMLRLGNAASRAGWTQSTYITVDTERMAADANETLVNAVTDFAKQAAKFGDAKASPAERRQLDLLRTSLTVAAPADPKEAEEVARVLAGMEATYGRGKYCPSGVQGEECLDIEEITEILAENRDPKRLQ